MLFFHIVNTVSTLEQTERALSYTILNSKVCQSHAEIRYSNKDPRGLSPFPKAGWGVVLDYTSLLQTPNFQKNFKKFFLKIPLNINNLLIV